jgi:hypothetical protein
MRFGVFLPAGQWPGQSHADVAALENIARLGEEVLPRLRAGRRMPSGPQRR